MKIFANFQKSGIGDKSNAENVDGNVTNDHNANFSSNFFDFCGGDNFMYYS